MRFLAFVLAAFSAHIVSADEAKIIVEGWDGITYVQTTNRHGDKLSAVGSDAVIYLGKNCDAYSNKHGNGRWWWANGGFGVIFSQTEIRFGRQEPGAYYPDCRD